MEKGRQINEGFGGDAVFDGGTDGWCEYIRQYEGITDTNGIGLLGIIPRYCVCGIVFVCHETQPEEGKKKNGVT